MYKYYMSTSGFKLAPYSMVYNFPHKSIRERVRYLVRPYYFIVPVIDNRIPHRKGLKHLSRGGYEDSKRS